MPRDADAEGMIVLRGLPALAIWILASLPAVYAQEPSAGGPDSSQETHANQPTQQPGAEPRGTADAPMFVQVIPAPKSAQERDHEAEDREEKREADRWLVRWTAALFFATFGLIVATGVLGYFAYRQLRDMKASIAVAGDAAEAAKKSAKIAEDALISTERAFVFLEDFDPNWSVQPRGSALQFGFFNIKPRWRNNGTTPTRNMAIAVNWTHREGDLPAHIPGTYAEEPVRMFLGPQATEWSEAIRIPGNIATDALYERTHIFIWGRVDYEDVFNGTAPHFTEWCYRLRFVNPAGGNIQTQFVAFGSYNRSDEDSREKREA
jgi:hypothetical protein